MLRGIVVIVTAQHTIVLVPGVCYTYIGFSTKSIWYEGTSVSSLPTSRAGIMTLSVKFPVDLSESHFDNSDNLTTRV